MKEIKSLTGIRGLAALYVLIGHIGILQNPDLFLTKIPFFRNLIDHGYISVDLFFILSGFVLMMMYHNKFQNNGYNVFFSKFMLKRFARILPLYIFCLILYLILNSLFFPKEIDYTFKDAFFNIFLIQTILGLRSVVYSSWSLSTEWVSYFLFPLLCFVSYKVFNKGRIRNIIIFLLVGIGLFGISKLPYYENYNNILKFQRTINVYNGVGASFRCIISIFYGCYIYLLSKEIKIAKYQLLITIIVVILLLTYYDYLNVVLLGMLIWSLSNDEGPIAKLLSIKPIYSIGQWSYSIYLLHPIIIGPVRDHLYFFLKEKNVGMAFPLSLSVSFFLVIFSSYLTFTYIEIPSKNFFTRIFLKKENQTTNQ